MKYIACFTNNWQGEGENIDADNVFDAAEKFVEEYDHDVDGVNFAVDEDTVTVNVFDCDGIFIRRVTVNCSITRYYIAVRELVK